MNKYKQFLEILDDVDSAVFGGDVLNDGELREEFRQCLIRWSKQVEIIQSVDDGDTERT